MPAPTTVSEYIELVAKTGLVTPERLQQSVTTIQSAPNAPQGVDDFAKACVANGLLTKFQSKQIRLGRYKKFILNGKYKILELIGTGGMGAVYLCEHKFMRRLVAIKILPADKYEDPSNLERFIREARAVAALNHPNIVRAYDIDKAEGMHFLVMEYVDGSSLQEIVARFGPFDPIRAAQCIAQSAVGLQHAHEEGLVHRDIKPGNLLIDRTGVIKLLDLGLARFFNPERDDKLTERYDEKCVLGTADYLAPEQAVSNAVDIRADIYGLGGTMYFLLTGRSPAPDGNVAQKLMFHQKEEPVAVTEFRKDVPEEILSVLARMMKKNPAERYQTPLEVAEALSPWAEQPLLAPPEYEMPDLCAAVTVLTGHAIERARTLSSMGGSGAMRFVVPKPKSLSGVSSAGMTRKGPISSHSSIGLASGSSVVNHPGDRASSTVDLRSPPPPHDGTTLANSSSHAATIPLPKPPYEPLSAETPAVRREKTAVMRSMSDICFTEEVSPDENLLAPRNPPALSTQSSRPRRWWPALLVAAVAISLSVAAFVVFSSGR